MTAASVSVTLDTSSLLSSLALVVAGYEREDNDLLRQELATSRRRQATAEHALTEIRWLIAGERRPEPTAEEWASVGVRPDLQTDGRPGGVWRAARATAEGRSLQADPPYADGAHAEPLDPDDDEGDIYPDLADEDARPSPSAPVAVTSQPPPSAPPAQPLPPTRRPPPPPAAPIQDPPRPVPAEAREGDIPDPGPTVADRRPALLACSTIEEAESCRRWPRWEAHEGTLEPELKRLMGLLQEVEAAERAGDAGVLRDIRSRKLLASRPGVAARCEAALDRLLEPPSPSSPPSAPSAAPEPEAVVSEVVEAAAPTVPAVPPKPVDLGACPWDSPV